MDMKEYSACVAAAFAAVKARVPFVPQVAIILGSGLGELAEAVNDPVIIPYGEIPGWKVSTAPGHIGRLLCGTIGGVCCPSMCPIWTRLFDGCSARGCIVSGARQLDARARGLHRHDKEAATAAGRQVWEHSPHIGR